jgi:CorA-like Mg2+ transporter protein
VNYVPLEECKSWFELLQAVEQIIPGATGWLSQGLYSLVTKNHETVTDKNWSKLVAKETSAFIHISLMEEEVSEDERHFYDEDYEENDVEQTPLFSSLDGGIPPTRGYTTDSTEHDRYRPNDDDGLPRRSYSVPDVYDVSIPDAAQGGRRPARTRTHDEIIEDIKTQIDVMKDNMAESEVSGDFQSSHEIRFLDLPRLERRLKNLETRRTTTDEGGDGREHGKDAQDMPTRSNTDLSAEPDIKSEPQSERVSTEIAHDARPLPQGPTELKPGMRRTETWQSISPIERRSETFARPITTRAASEYATTYNHQEAGTRNVRFKTASNEDDDYISPEDAEEKHRKWQEEQERFRKDVVHDSNIDYVTVSPTGSEEYMQRRPREIGPEDTLPYGREFIRAGRSGWVLPQRQRGVSPTSRGHSYDEVGEIDEVIARRRKGEDVFYTRNRSVSHGREVAVPTEPTLGNPFYGRRIRYIDENVPTEREQLRKSTPHHYDDFHGDLAMDGTRGERLRRPRKYFPNQYREHPGPKVRPRNDSDIYFKLPETPLTHTNTTPSVTLEGLSSDGTGIAAQESPKPNPATPRSPRPRPVSPHGSPRSSSPGTKTQVLPIFLWSTSSFKPHAPPVAKKASNIKTSSGVPLNRVASTPERQASLTAEEEMMAKILADADTKLRTSKKLTDRSIYAQWSTEKTVQEVDTLLKGLHQPGPDNPPSRLDDLKPELINLAKKLMDAFVPAGFRSTITSIYWGALWKVIDVKPYPVEQEIFLKMVIAQMTNLTGHLENVQNGVAHGDPTAKMRYSIPKALVEAFYRLVLFAILVGNSANVLISGAHEPTFKRWCDAIINSADQCADMLVEGKNQLILMIYTEDHRERVSYEAVKSEAIIALVMERLLQATLTVDDNPSTLELSEAYSEYMSKLEIGVREHPSVRVFEDIKYLSEELDIISRTLQSQVQVLDDFTKLSYSGGENQRNNHYNPRYWNYSQSFQSMVQGRAREDLIQKIDEFRELKDRANATQFLAAQTISVKTESKDKAILIFTIVTVIFLPLSFITSYLGMNVTDIRDMNKDQGLFWYIALPLTVVIFLLAVYVSQRSPGQREWWNEVRWIAWIRGERRRKDE